MSFLRSVALAHSSLTTVSGRCGWASLPEAGRYPTIAAVLGSPTDTWGVQGELAGE
jgi:hypothetical protein